MEGGGGGGGGGGGSLKIMGLGEGYRSNSWGCPTDLHTVCKSVGCPEYQHRLERSRPLWSECLCLFASRLCHSAETCIRDGYARASFTSTESEQRCVDQDKCRQELNLLHTFIFHYT